MGDGGMSGRSVRILLVEDSEDDAILLIRELTRGGYAVESHRVDAEGTLRDALRQPWDLVISDFSMPDFSGLQAFEILRSVAPQVPVIFVSGVLGEDRAVEAMRLGARDYFVKGKITRLCAAVGRELGEVDNRRKRVDAERALAREERRYRSIFESASVGIIEVDLTCVGAMIDAVPPEARADVRAWLRSSSDSVTREAQQLRVVAANRAAKGMLAVATLEQLGAFIASRGAGPSSVWDEIVETIALRKSSFEREVEIETSDKHVVNVLLSATIPDNHADLGNVVLAIVDFAERRRLENQMRAVQRMESVGRLAGGIAHDFNNILAVVTTYAGFVAEDGGLNERGREDVAAIIGAAKRAASLTQQLLAFSRRQRQHPVVLDLNATVRGFHLMIRRVVGEDVHLALHLGEHLGHIRADPSQLEQVLLNLVVNARDAMPTGGRLTIETANVELGADYGLNKLAEVPPGSYVSLTVSDSGVGMDEATRSRAFEPFFTTKAAGKGTGLGLSTVYGIVKQSGGFVWIYSEPGHGTAFKIYYPRTEEAHQVIAKPAPLSVVDGTETIVLAEDEVQVRRALRRILERHGYQVLEALDAAHALRLCEEHPGHIDLLLTDVVMPNMSGSELAEGALVLRPQLKTLFMSGYTATAIVDHGMLGAGEAYLTKPFTREELLQRLREVLDKGGSPRS